VIFAGLELETPGVREKYCWLAGAGAGGWSGVREKYCYLTGGWS